MSNKDLYNAEAKKKIKEMAENIDFAMMATNLKETPLHMIPMSTKKVDEQGNIWFLSNKNSNHNENLLSNPNLHLIYSNKGDMQFLNVYGMATITTDQKIIDELYGKADDTWFEGKDDPNITAISVKPTEAYYWDPKDNKLVTLVKMGVGAITGNEPDLMDQGKIKL
ncbi:pyridoxamine 5'-phosphate oxidase family protein [Subsaxibacter sp. CAU 1640]|uniref:pyridoxamine 5'-phosphate oxidase family protein n=1 Tax=Subsaxibacter sp. CAU 1640 TaxID=2933271 RepID=UPI00200319C6|nr:pyridoxamine 5'-phosphate oxidase family protein [Subsaxibacter sp. CAU 1640]MCK7590887.1 pyridoxamine 5'-phosphate oxidase family protein [Subsaxibacter sp. CAU 1640]